jgi:dephospho-CoA kinase
MRMFGLTGGIASGKSTVAARFRARGLPVLDADRIAREVVLPGTPGLAALVEAFGEGVLADDGTLDRKALAALVFGDAALRRRLDAIVHPRIAARTAELAAELEARGAPLACYEAALLVENGLVEAFRPLVVVALPEAQQLERARLRDGSTEAEARARLASQRPLADKVALADVVIDTSGTRDEVNERADRALDEVTARLGLAPLPPAAAPPDLAR